VSVPDNIIALLFIYAGPFAFVFLGHFTGFVLFYFLAAPSAIAGVWLASRLSRKEKPPLPPSQKVGFYEGRGE